MYITIIITYMRIVLKNIHIFPKSNEIRRCARLSKQNIGLKIVLIIFRRLVHW